MALQHKSGRRIVTQLWMTMKLMIAHLLWVAQGSRQLSRIAPAPRR